MSSGPTPCPRPTTPPSTWPRLPWRSKGTLPAATKGFKVLFGLRFVKTGRLPAELASILRELKDERENGDYSIFPAISQEEAERAVQSATRFVDEVEEFLREQGFQTGD